MINLTKSLWAAFFALVIVSMASCGSKDEEKNIGQKSPLNNISATASAVGILDMGQLMKKADYATVVELPVFKNFLQEVAGNKEELKDVLLDPKKSGIDVNAQIVLSVDIKEDPENPEVAIYVPLSDAKSLKDKFLEKAKEKESKVEEVDGFTIIRMTAKNSAIFGEDMLIVSSLKEAAALKALFDAKENNINSNASFANSKGQNKDIFLWMNTDAIGKAAIAKKAVDSKAQASLGFLQLTQEDVLMGNNFSFFYNFADGKVEMGSDMDFNDKLDERLGKIFRSEMKADLTSYIGIESLVMSMGLSLDLSEVFALVKAAGVQGLADAQMKNVQAPFTLEELTNGLTGDIAFSTNPQQGMNAQVAIAMGISNKEFGTKLLDYAASMSQGKLAKVGENYEVQAPTGKVTAMLKDDAIVITNVEALVAAGGKATNKRLASLDKNTMYFYTSIEDVMQMTKMLPMLDPQSKAAANMVNEVLPMDYALTTLKNGTALQEIVFKSSDKNTLRLLIEAADKLYQNKDALAPQAPSTDAFSDMEELEDEM